MMAMAMRAAKKATGLAACKESTVRKPRASGLCYWASEFCF